MNQLRQDRRLVSYTLRSQIQRGKLPLMALVIVFLTACSSSSNQESDSDFFGDIADFFDEEFNSIFGDDEDTTQEEKVAIVRDDSEGFPDLASVPNVDTLSIEERQEALKGGLIADTGELYSQDTLQADNGPALGQTSPMKESLLYPELNPVPSPELLSSAVPTSQVPPPSFPTNGGDRDLPSPVLPLGMSSEQAGASPLAPPTITHNARSAVAPSVPHALPPALLPPGTSEDPYRSYYDDGVGRDDQLGSTIIPMDKRRPRFNQGQSQASLNDRPQSSYPFSHQSAPVLNTNPVPAARYDMQPSSIQPRIGYATSSSVRLGTIYFAHGSAKLTAKDRKILKQIATIQQHHGGGIYIVGHASHPTKHRRGAEHQLANYRISSQRADQVANALQRMGVPRKALSIAAYSDSRPEYAETAPTGEAGNRRVVLYLTRG